MTRSPWSPKAIGALREQVTLIRPKTTGEDALGHAVIAWQCAGTAWARAEVLQTEETFRSAAITATKRLRFHIRHRDDVDPTWRVRWNGTDYEITGVWNPDERRRFLAIEAVGAALNAKLTTTEEMQSLSSPPHTSLA
jgi:SPP1 family predicted phage head-tail adaptor